jgi:DNA-binding PadR family transcriptional regulator
MANKINIVPFGELRLSQVSRLGIVTGHRIQSTLVIRWPAFSLAFGGVLSSFPAITDPLKRALANRGKDQNITRGEYDQLGNAFDAMSQYWERYIAARRNANRKRVLKWLDSSRRGFFRLVLLLAILYLDKAAVVAGNKLLAKGLASAAKHKIESASGGLAAIKAGSLYIALTSFEKQGLLDTESGIATLTPRGLKFLSKILEALTPLIKAFQDQTISENSPQRVVEAGRPMLAEILKKPADSLKFADFASISSDLLAKISQVLPLLDQQVADDYDFDAAVKDWRGDLNRGAIDMFVLGKMFAAPEYGTNLIKQARDSLGFQAGTLYPKFKEYLLEDLVYQISENDKAARLRSGTFPKRGPEKIFYDLTPQGALHFVMIWHLFLGDLRLLLNLLTDYIDLTAPKPPTQAPPA